VPQVRPTERGRRALLLELRGPHPVADAAHELAFAVPEAAQSHPAAEAPDQTFRDELRYRLPRRAAILR